MLYGNQMEVALRKAGLIEGSRKPKKIRHKKFKCYNCGKTMYYVENTNTMACECGQYFIFNKVA